MNQCIERAIFLSTGSEINAEDLGLPHHKKTSLAVENAGGLKIEFPARGISLEKVEKEIILEALKAAKGNVSQAARFLRIGREALRYRIKKYSISKEIKLG